MFRRFFLTVTFLLCLFPMTAASQSLPSSPIPPMKDDRLARKVTVERWKVYTGEILEEVSRQTGVKLTARETDGASGQAIAVYVHGMPLADFMENIASLLSYRGATWSWRVQSQADEQGKPVYRLEKSRAAELFPATIDDAIQKKIEADLEEAIQCLKLDPETLTERRKANPELDTMLKDPRCYRNIAGFAACLTPEQRRAVLRNEKEFVFDYQKLPPDAKLYVDKEVELFRRNNPHLDNVIPPPRTIVLHGDTFPQTSLVPSAFFGIQGIGGYAVCGGIPSERYWEDKMRELWMQEGDSRSHPLEAKRLPTTPSNRELTPEEKAYGRLQAHAEASVGGDPEALRTGDPPRPDILGRRLQQLSELAPVNIMARLPLSRRDKDPGAPFGLTVAEFLAKLSLQSKWRKDTLLLNHTLWFRDERNLYPIKWSILKGLREKLDSSPQGILSLTDVCGAANDLTQKQMTQLENDVLFEGTSLVIKYRDLLAALHRHPEIIAQLSSREGVVFNRMPRSVQIAFAQQLSPPNATGSSPYRAEPPESPLVVQKPVPPTAELLSGYRFRFDITSPAWAGRAARNIKIMRVSPEGKATSFGWLFWTGKELPPAAGTPTPKQ
jgi:hypothetical protein